MSTVARNENTNNSTNTQPFLTDVSMLRQRAKEHLNGGAVMPSYEGDVGQTIELLQTVLATELVCVLRYTMHSITAQGIHSESVGASFAEKAADEQRHAHLVASRIDQLGGNPNYNPDGLEMRATTEYGDAEELIDMIKEDLVAERIVIEHYTELIRHFALRDPTTRLMLERILADEEDHATDMHDLLVARQGEPFIEG